MNALACNRSCPSLHACLEHGFQWWLHARWRGLGRPWCAGSIRRHLMRGPRRIRIRQSPRCLPRSRRPPRSTWTVASILIRLLVVWLALRRLASRRRRLVARLPRRGGWRSLRPARRLDHAVAVEGCSALPVFFGFDLPTLVLAFRGAIAHMLVFRLFEGSMMALSFTLGPVDTSREATNVSQLCWRPDGNSLIVLSYSSLSLSSIASVLVLVWLTQPRYPLRKPPPRKSRKTAGKVHRASDCLD